MLYPGVCMEGECYFGRACLGAVTAVPMKTVRSNVRFLSIPVVLLLAAL